VAAVVPTYIRGIPEVSKLNKDPMLLLVKCIPDDGSDTKECAGAFEVPELVNRLLVNRPVPDTSRGYAGAFVPIPNFVPSNTRFDCATAALALVPVAVRTRLAPGFEMVVNPAPVGPVYPV
jgi:hypothetical protein